MKIGSNLIKRKGNFKTLVICGILMMFVFSSVNAAYIFKSNSPNDKVNEMDNPSFLSKILNQIESWLYSRQKSMNSDLDETSNSNGNEKGTYFFGAIQWNATLEFDETGGSYGSAELGEATDATDGSFPDSYDEP